jgi:hypothetical protein
VRTPRKTCIPCNMEVELYLDGRPVHLEHCPICGARLCTCPNGGDPGHQDECPFWQHSRQDRPQEKEGVRPERYWRLFGLMRKHFPKLRVEQIRDYTGAEMEELLREHGVDPCQP